jgi:hypothetical protein
LYTQDSHPFCAATGVNATCGHYYSRFDNLFSGPGIVERGRIAPLPRTQSIEELAENLLICTATEWQTLRSRRTWCLATASSLWSRPRRSDAGAMLCYA